MGAVRALELGASVRIDLQTDRNLNNPRCLPGHLRNLLLGFVTCLRLKNSQIVDGRPVCNPPEGDTNRVRGHRRVLIVLFVLSLIGLVIGWRHQLLRLVGSGQG
jgi:hypothetical protein